MIYQSLAAAPDRHLRASSVPSPPRLGQSHAPAWPGLFGLASRMSL